MMRLFSLLIAGLMIVPAVSHAETQRECAEQAMKMLHIIGNENRDIREIRLAASGLGVTGSSLGVLAIHQFHNIRSLVPDMSLYGGGTVLAAIAILNSTRPSRNHSPDSLRRFRTTPEYQCLVMELGQDQAEEYIAHIAGGWEIPALIERYLSSDQQDLLREFLR